MGNLSTLIEGAETSGECKYAKMQHYSIWAAEFDQFYLRLGGIVLQLQLKLKFKNPLVSSQVESYGLH